MKEKTPVVVSKISPSKPKSGVVSKTARSSSQLSVELLSRKRSMFSVKSVLISVTVSACLSVLLTVFCDESEMRETNTFICGFKKYK